MNQYEGMFLFDPTFAATFENCEQEIRRLMDRIGAELLFCKLWDERRLAFRIKGRKRGAYVLTYFKCDPSKIAELEGDARLSEQLLRLLVLRAEGYGEEQFERSMTMAQQTEERGGGDDDRRGPRRGGRDRDRDRGDRDRGDRDRGDRDRGDRGGRGDRTGGERKSESGPGGATATAEKTPEESDSD